MTIKELLRERKTQVREYRKLVDEAEQRGALTAEDKVEFDKREAAIKDLDAQIAERDEVDVSDFNGALTQAGRGDRSESVFLTREQSMADWLEHRSGRSIGLDGRDEREDFNIARYLRGVIEPDFRRYLSEYEQRAIVVGSGPDGGVLFPDLWSARLVDLARKQARLFEAGAITIPMGQSTVKLPRLTEGVQPTWRAEGATQSEDTMTFDVLTLEAKTMMVLAKISIEALEDATPEAAALIEGDLSKACALELDRVGLYGTGASNQPLGLKPRLVGTGQEITNGANGTALANYTNHVKTIGKVRAGNFEPSALIYSARTDEKQNLFVDTTNQPLRQPPSVEQMTKLVTNQVKDDNTVGTSNDCSDIFTGQWNMLGFGLRPTVGSQVKLLSERFIDSGHYGLLIWLRGDVISLRDSAFAVATGIRP